MRLVTAFLVSLILGHNGTASAQSTNPSAIQVTQRNYLQRVVKTPPITTIPRCGVLDGPNSASERPVYCGVVPSAPNWTPDLAPKLSYQQQMQAAKRGFAALDLNHDGVVSRREWSLSEARAMAPIPARNRAEFKCQLDQEFKLVDGNHNGKITFAEWTADHFGKDRQPIRACQ